MLNSSEKAIKSTLTGIVISFFLVIIKGTAGILGNSYALVADAVESASDVFTSVILWIGIKVASKEPDQNHPYGHGKAEPIAAIIVSLSLVIAAFFIAVHSVENILTPHKSPASFTLWILAAVVIIKEILYRYVEKVGQEVKSTAVKADAWHHRSDAITSAAAFVGISISLIAGDGYESADDWAALLSSVIIIVNAYHIFKPAFGEIMDEAPQGEIVESIKGKAAEVNGVKEVEKCYVRKMGFDYFVDMHIKVDGNISVHDGHKIAHQVKDAIMKYEKNVYDVLIHIEPYE